MLQILKGRALDKGHIWLQPLSDAKIVHTVFQTKRLDLGSVTRISVLRFDVVENQVVERHIVEKKVVQTPYCRNFHILL
jgi:hypothetical protein